MSNFYSYPLNFCATWELFDRHQEVHKGGNRVGSNKLPMRDLVHLKLKLMPNHWISQLKTECDQLDMFSCPFRSFSSINPKFLEKSNPEIARAASSAWLAPNSRLVGWTAAWTEGGLPVVNISHNVCISHAKHIAKENKQFFIRCLQCTYCCCIVLVFKTNSSKNQWPSQNM